MTDTSISTPPDCVATPAMVVTPARRRTALTVIVLGTFLHAFGFGVWQSLFNNFAVQELGMQAGQVGWTQAIREIPGLLGFAVGLLAFLLPEMRIASLSLILMGAGIVLTGTVSEPQGLILSTLVMSFGFHFFVPCNSSSVLMLIGKDESPRTLGRLSSLGALFALIAAGVVFLALGRLGFRNLYYVTGVIVAVGGLALQPWAKQPMRPVRTRLLAYVRKRYWLYYALEFLMGSRRHIFTTFAAFLLVKDYHVGVQGLTALFVINNLAGTIVYRQFGRIISRFGERRVLTLNFALLVLVFLGYAYVPLLPFLLVLFVLDHVLFGFGIALQSYFQKIALHPDEITPNLSLGQAINHIAAIIIPVVGGMVWETLGGRYTFLIGVVIVAISLGVVQWMHLERDAVPPAVAQGDDSV